MLMTVAIHVSVERLKLFQFFVQLVECIVDEC